MVTRTGIAIFGFMILSSWVQTQPRASDVPVPGGSILVFCLSAPSAFGRELRTSLDLDQVDHPTGACPHGVVGCGAGLAPRIERSVSVAVPSAATAMLTRFGPHHRIPVQVGLERRFHIGRRAA